MLYRYFHTSLFFSIDSSPLWHSPELKRAQASNYIRFGKRSDATSNEEEVALVPEVAGDAADTLAPVKRTKESGYIRFGKRVPDGYIRFGKRAGVEDNKGFIRFGRAQKEAFIRFGKRAQGDAFIR